jgi:lipoyl(octanoyl) transferase
MAIVRVKDLGNKPYKEVWSFQEQHMDLVINQKIERRTNPDILPDSFLFLVEHPPVFTLGKSGKPEHLLVSEEELSARSVDYFKINRGGDITFHGPGQMVAYPILDLDQIYTDIHRYLRDLEEVVIRTIADFGIRNGTRKEGLTGVWVGEEKICAMGVRASRWVTMHGLALNVNTELDYFSWIVPCGIDDKAVTSMKKILKNAIDPNQVKQSFLKHFSEVFPVVLTSYEG